ncbi:MAG: hypothetical protein HZB65_03185 [Candidatus Aenigmarchaeota archaeon]|nr:hypothetical protein [Candidatus Aenigmarchaeota archaeon]
MKLPKYVCDVGKGVCAVGAGAGVAYLLWTNPVARLGIMNAYTSAENTCVQAWDNVFDLPAKKEINAKNTETCKKKFLDSLSKTIQNTKLEETGKTSTGKRRVFSATDANGRSLEIYEYNNSGKRATDQYVVLCKSLGDSVLYIENTGMPYISLSEDKIYLDVLHNLLKDLENNRIERADSSVIDGNKLNVIEEMRKNMENIQEEKPGNSYKSSGETLLQLCEMFKE